MSRNEQRRGSRLDEAIRCSFLACDSFARASASLTAPHPAAPSISPTTRLFQFPVAADVSPLHSPEGCLKTRPVRAPGLQERPNWAISCRPRALTRRFCGVFKQALGALRLAPKSTPDRGPGRPNQLSYSSSRLAARRADPRLTTPGRGILPKRALRHSSGRIGSKIE